MRTMLGLCSSVLLFCVSETWVTPVLTCFVETDTVQTVHCLGIVVLAKASPFLACPHSFPNQPAALNPSPSGGRIWKVGAAECRGERGTPLWTLQCGRQSADYPRVTHKCFSHHCRHTLIKHSMQLPVSPLQSAKFLLQMISH